MADLTRLNRYRAELKKMKDRRTEMDIKIRDLERKCREEENTAIHDLVHEARMTPEQLASLIGMSTEEKIKSMKGANTDGEGGEKHEDEETY